MGKHTSGPWKITPGGQCVDSESARVCNVMDRRDACLISVAPELLAACKRALEFLEFVDLGPVGPFDERARIVADLKSVIEKADK